LRPDLGHDVRAQRLGVLGFFVVLCFGLLGVRSFQLQVLDADSLRDKQRRQTAQKIDLPAIRGDIVDREGVLLATTVVRYDLNVSTSDLGAADRKRIAETVSRITGEPYARLRARLRRPDPVVLLAYGISEGQVEALHREALPHVSFSSRMLRSYPTRSVHGDTLAAAFVGFAGMDENALSGIELAFNEELHGNPITLQIQRDGRRRRILERFSPPRARQGKTLRLTIDARLQFEAERVLARTLERTQAQTASLIALDPRNGDVLAVAEAPGYDQNHFWREDAARFRARGIQDGFEPGSVIKPFVVATALDRHAISEEDRFDCGNGRLRVKDRVIRDLDPHDSLDAAGALRFSSNICLTRIGERLGSHSLVAGLRHLGFGQRTTSAFPGEAEGMLRDLDENQAVERANLSFGQGMRASALQLGLAAATLAQGGRRIQPRMVLSLGDDVRPTGATQERVLSPETATRVLEMLRGVVDGGTGKNAAMEHYTVGGKTGTAQKVVDGKYSHKHLITSFWGIVPLEDPRLVVVVVLDEPHQDQSGGASAAPAFREFAEAALVKLEVVARAAP